MNLDQMNCVHYSTLLTYEH